MTATRAELDEILDGLAQLVAQGAVTADEIAPIWEATERDIAAHAPTVGDRIAARLAKTPQTAIRASSDAKLSSDGPAP